MPASLRSLARLLLVAAIATSAVASATPRGIPPFNFVDVALRSRPEIAARDRALTLLYRAALIADPLVAKRKQRAWVASSRQCRDLRCLNTAYDERIGWFLEHRAGEIAANRFHWESGQSNGDLFVLLNNGWVTYDVLKTEIGRDGVAAGDVYVAHLTGTAKLIGSSARDPGTSGCQLLLRQENLRSWTLTEGANCQFYGITLSGRYIRTGRGR